jgi:YD repeat-containing protein
LSAPGQVVLRAEDGAEIAFALRVDGTYQRPPGVRSQLRALLDGYEVTRADQLRYRFDLSGRLVSLADRSGATTTLAYDSSGRLASVLNTARVATLAYQGTKVVGLSLPDGRALSYAYSGDLLTSASDPTGATTTYAYDPGARLARITDPNGNVEVDTTYDASGRVVSQADAMGEVTTFAWDATTQTSTMTDAAGAVWTDVYHDMCWCAPLSRQGPQRAATTMPSTSPAPLTPRETPPAPPTTPPATP